MGPSVRAGRAGGDSGATGGATVSPEGRRSAASSRCAISARFWSADCTDTDGARRRRCRRGGAFGRADRRRRLRRLACARRPGNQRLSAGEAWHDRIGVRDSGRDSRRPPIGSGAKPASGSLRRSGIGGAAGRRTSSAKEGRVGRGGGSGICGSPMIEGVGGSRVRPCGFTVAPRGIGQRGDAGRLLGRPHGPRRHLIARRRGADDIGFHHDVGRPADHQQMLDIVAPHQHQAPAAIDGGGVDHGQPRHPSAIGVGAEAVAGESAHQPGGERRSAPERR